MGIFIEHGVNTLRCKLQHIYSVISNNRTRWGVSERVGLERGEGGGSVGS